VGRHAVQDRNIRVDAVPGVGYSGCMMEDEGWQQASDYQRVEQAIQFLEQSFTQQPSLDEIAQSVHLSKYHFQRLFKRWAGISPTQFLQFLTMEHAKQRLEESQSVLDTALDAGLSGPGRLHDLFLSFEAITPGEYKQQGLGVRITYGFHPTPFGHCLLATTPRGICGLYFVEVDDRLAALDLLAEAWPRAHRVQNETVTQPLVDRIFRPAAPDRAGPFHLFLRGTNFQVQVWQALLAIPSGALVNYEQVAAYLGRPKATRAVANAIARNPVAYLIPCHRVIAKTGRIHRYRWGTARKKAMVCWEASRRTQAEAAHGAGGQSSA
jgi:AraC family transcriptional regulator, regulatory protein of adaptative response / methylated-DNA-[protein]-cysteine methyltransferase